MNEITNSNLENRLKQILGRLGELAYERRGLTLRTEVIDTEVGQMEAQRVLIEATRNDLKVDQENETGRLEKERERDEGREEDTAKKRKGKTTKETPRERKAAAAS